MRQRSGTESDSRGSSGDGPGTWLGSITGTTASRGFPIGRCMITRSSGGTCAELGGAVCAIATEVHAMASASVTKASSAADCARLEAGADILFAAAVERRLRTIHVAQSRAFAPGCELVGAHRGWSMADAGVE